MKDNAGQFIGYFYGVADVMNEILQPETGMFFINGETNSIWMWDTITKMWINTNRLDSGFKGMIDNPDTFVPTYENGIKVCYFYSVEHDDCDANPEAEETIIAFTHFKNGNQSVSATIRKSSIVILYWNGTYWETKVTPFINLNYSVYATVANLNNEINRAIANEERLQTAINEETTRAGNVEQSLLSAIQNEVTRATDAEEVLQTQITNNTNAIATETENREQAEEELRGDLSEFSAAVMDSINNNRTAIQNEVTRATDAEEELQTTINSTDARTAHIEQLASVLEADNINVTVASTTYIVNKGKAFLIFNSNGAGIGQMKQTLIEDGRVLFRENIKVGATTMDATYWSRWKENIDTTPIMVGADGVIDIESGSSFIVPLGVQSISFVQPTTTNYHKKITLVCTGDVMFPADSVMRGSTGFTASVTISYHSLSGRSVISPEYPMTLTVDCVCVNGNWKYIVS